MQVTQQVSQAMPSTNLLGAARKLRSSETTLNKTEANGL